MPLVDDKPMVYKMEDIAPIEAGVEGETVIHQAEGSGPSPFRSSELNRPQLLCQKPVILPVPSSHCDRTSFGMVTSSSSDGTSNDHDSMLNGGCASTKPSTCVEAVEPSTFIGAPQIILTSQGTGNITQSPLTDSPPRSPHILPSPPVMPEKGVPSLPPPPKSPEPGLPDTLPNAPVCNTARVALADDLVNDVESDKLTTLNVAPELDLGRKSAYHGPKGICTRNVITTKTEEAIHSMCAACRELNCRCVAAFKNWFFWPLGASTGQLLLPPPDGNNAGQSDAAQSAADAMVMPRDFTPASGSH
ncbi:hypothetical protein DACRYDRAFT_15933 [Dacryopinax primogenitus]|uniref:Uncharacterized protein n=1 Tax=Dacryopinax primogenitus (strain DJM 731) TaxID=1858805 RepID=M5G1A9_DACPD|nr:uncharacterized protein DACRYDRAFT_15933 [Dacryopinax primogenitus]EJU01975.1 hypothetical protein DACRYDRAFT_15933 [Dacryopinax primogenitus]